MTKIMILLISIFSLWAFLSLTKNKGQEKQGIEKYADDGIRFTNNTLVSEVTV